MGMNVRVLDQATLRAKVGISREAPSVVETALAALGRGGVIMPPVLRMDLSEQHAEVGMKTARVPAPVHSSQDLDGVLRQPEA